MNDKEIGGLDMARSFLAWLGWSDVRPVPAGEDSNKRLGDLRVGEGGPTIEVKRQPVDPIRFPQNFVEIGQVRQGPPGDGLEVLGAQIGLAPALLSRVSVRTGGHRGIKRPLSDFPHWESSLSSVAGSSFTIYCNPVLGWLLMYERSELLFKIRAACFLGDLVLGAGKSRPSTLAAGVDYPRVIAQQRVSAIWWMKKENRDLAIRLLNDAVSSPRLSAC